MRICIIPTFTGADAGDGGIRRVVEAQRKYLPSFGVELVDDPGMADVVAVHGAADANVRPEQLLVAHCHGLYWDDYADSWVSWHHHANGRVIDLLRRADVITAPSEWVAQALRRGMMRPVDVFYQGIEPSEWTAGANGGYVLWNKTRVDPVCDPGPIEELAHRLPQVRFLTTFYPNEEPPPNVRVTGKLPYAAAQELIRNAGVYLATTRETWGIGTLEAMAAGVPVVGWAWGGQREIVAHGESGYLTRPGDFEGLAEYVEQALKERTKLGKAAARVARKEHAWRPRIEWCARLYKEAWEKHSATRPKVSVVITCYNLADMLPRAVQSVHSQENPPEYEIVIVNDASPDNTAAVAAGLAGDDSRVRVVTNDANLYLAGSLNAGISAANGRYIVPLDADNELGPRALRVLSDALDASREVDIAYGAMQVIEEREGGNTFISGWPTDFDFRAQMAHRNQIPSTSMYRRTVWERAGGYRRRCRTAEDADFWCRATSFGARPARVTDAVTLIYHDRAASMSHVEKDWPWEAWYSWSRRPELTPWVAARPAVAKPRVPTFEPTLVSVVIPVGPGHGIYVQDAIDSLVAQTMREWECIVVNDSGAPLPPLLQFVKVVEIPGGGRGPAFARNAGVAAARGRAIVPLDADDYLQPEALAMMWEEYEAWEGRAYVYTDWAVVETGQVHETPEYDCDRMFDKLHHAVTAMYPRSAWEKVGGMDVALDGWEDWDFVIALAAQGVCGVRMAAPVFRYRMYAGQRREQLYARVDELKVNIRRKWAEYIDGGKRLMACGGCGQRAAPPPPPPVAAGPGAPPAEGMVLLEYVGEQGPLTYRGQATGTAYRVGPYPGQQLRYVYAADAEHLLMRDEFRVAPTSLNGTVMQSPALEAAGPPQREAERALA